MQQRWVIVLSVVVLLVVGIIGAALIFGGGDDDGDDEANGTDTDDTTLISGDDDDSANGTDDADTMPVSGDDDDQQANGGEFRVEEAWIRATAPMGGDDSESEGGTAGAVTGAFMIIENRTDADETLVSAAVDSDIATVVEIHETTFDENDVMQMRPVEGGIEVPSMGNLVLKPGGYHVMLIDVQRALTPGEMIPVTLTFESGREITVEAEVREMTAGGSMDGMGSE